MVRHLCDTRRPAIVIAASGMCAGGRIVDYLKTILGDPRHNVLFVGYQAQGAPGQAIQKYGPRGGYVDLEGERIAIRAGIETLGGYSPPRPARLRDADALLAAGDPSGAWRGAGSPASGRGAAGALCGAGHAAGGAVGAALSR